MSIINGMTPQQLRENAEVDGPLCDCGACQAQRFANSVEIEQRLGQTHPRPNAPTTMRLQ